MGSGSASGLKAAIILAAPWQGGSLRFALALARLLASRLWDGVGAVDPVVALNEAGGYDHPAILAELKGDGPGRPSLRRLGWTARPAAHVPAMFPAARPVHPGVDTVALPTDGGWNLMDCDMWFHVTSHSVGYMPALRPTAVFVADLVPRYVAGFVTPDTLPAYRNTMLGWRQAEVVWATTQGTQADIVSYAGIPKRRTALAPVLADPLPAGRSTPPAEATGLLWVTNESPHKNHPAAVAALAAYVEAGGSLPVTVCGLGVGALDPARGSGHPGARAFAAEPALLARTRFVPQASDAAYLGLIAAAEIVWHNVIMDNGTYVAVDAARANRHFVSSDYPQMRELCRNHGVAARFHPAWDTMAARDALLAAEAAARRGEDPGHLPPRDEGDEQVAAYGDILRRLAAVIPERTA